MVALLLFMLPWACKYNDDLWNRASDKIDDIPPEVFSCSLSDGAGITSPLVIRFNDDMMYNTLDAGTIIIKEGADIVPGTFSSSQVAVTGGYETQVSFIPTADYNGGTSGATFKRGTAYTVTVTTGVRDYYGNNMESDDDTGNFTTAAGLALDADASSIDVNTDAASHRIRLTFNDPPANGWQVSVYDSDGSLAVLATPAVFDGSSAGVSASEDSRYIIIPTGVAFNTGVDVSVTAFTAFSAAIDSAGLADPGTVSLTVPAPAP